ncbi:MULTISPECIES: cell surface protein [unclassified Streptomyces]|uniref:cell surface protein n=1 Tax=unclassified Streptomyces TaxID=2593676 RepID=UPI00381E292B
MTETTADHTPAGIGAAFSVPDTGGAQAAVFMIRGGWAVQHDAALSEPPRRGTTVRELWPNLPGAFPNGFDAACSTNTPRVYLFKGSTCVLYDMERNAPVGGVAPIEGKFPGLLKDDPAFTGGIDAGLPAPDGTIHLFRGDRWVNYDVEYDEVVDRGAIAERWGSPEFPGSEVHGGVAAAFNSPNSRNGFLVAPGGKRYVECDTRTHRITSAGKALRDRWPYRTFVGVVEETEGMLWVFDAASGQKIRQVQAGRSGSVSIAPDGFRALAPVDRDGQLALVDITAGTRTTLATGGRPYGVAALPDGSAAYVGDTSGPSIRAVDLTTGTTTSIDVGSDVYGLVAAPDGRYVYASCYPRAEVAVVDTERQSVVRRLDAFNKPSQTVITPDGSVLGIASSEAGNGYVVLASTSGGSARTVRIGQDAMGVAASPDSRIVYAVDLASEVKVIDIASASQIGAIGGSGRLSSVVADPDGQHLYVTAYMGNAVQKLSVSTGEKVDEFPLGMSLNQYAYVGIGQAWG